MVKGKHANILYSFVLEILLPLLPWAYKIFRSIKYLGKINISSVFSDDSLLSACNILDIFFDASLQA